MRLSYSAQDRLDLAETAKASLVNSTSSVETCSTVFGGEDQSGAETSKTQTC